MFRTEINGLSVTYRREGHGPALVLLHGFTQDSRIWAPQVADLSSSFTIIAWDAPGAGYSDDPPSTFTIADWADTLAGVLDVEDIPRAHIAGLSWGGLLAQEFYRRYASRVASLVLVDTYAGWSGSLSGAVATDRLDACLKDSCLPPHEFVDQYLPGMFSDNPPPDAAATLANIMVETHPLGFQLMARALAAGDTRDLLPEISVSTLLIWGEADKRSPLYVAHQLQQRIRHSKLAVIPNAGHVSNLEAPSIFNGLVREFLQAHPT